MTGAKAAKEPVKDSTAQREAYFLAFAEKARQAVSIPLVVTGGFRTGQAMAQAIESGAVDMVGIARSMAIEPDVCTRLLSGQNPQHPVKPIKTGIGFIDKMGLMEITWYTGQLKRIGQGHAPDPRESALWVFLKFIAKQVGLGRGGKKPTRLRAS